MDKGEAVQISPSLNIDSHPLVIKATTKAQLREATLNNNMVVVAPVFKEDQATRDCRNRTTQNVPSSISHIAVLEDYLQRITTQVAIRIWQWLAEVAVFLREMAQEILQVVMVTTGQAQPHASSNNTLG